MSNIIGKMCKILSMKKLWTMPHHPQMNGPPLFDVWGQAKASSQFYFPTFRSAEVPRWGASAKHVNEHVATVRDCLRATHQKAQTQSTAEAQRQKWYYDWKIGAIGFKPGDLILVKADTFQGKRKIKDRWEDKLHEVVHQITTDIPLYEVKDQHRCSHVLHHNQLLLIASEAGIYWRWVKIPSDVK